MPMPPLGPSSSLLYIHVQVHCIYMCVWYMFTGCYMMYVHMFCGRGRCNVHGNMMCMCTSITCNTPHLTRVYMYIYITYFHLRSTYMHGASLSHSLTHTHTRTLSLSPYRQLIMDSQQDLQPWLLNHLTISCTLEPRLEN